MPQKITAIDLLLLVQLADRNHRGVSKVYWQICFIRGIANQEIGTAFSVIFTHGAPHNMAEVISDA